MFCGDTYSGESGGTFTLHYRRMISFGILLLTLLMLCPPISSSSLNEGVRSRIYDLQNLMCGSHFCVEGGSIEAPFSHHLTTVNVPENTSGLEDPPSSQLQIKLHRHPCAECNCEDNCRVYGDCCANKHIGGQFYFDCEKIQGLRGRAVITYHMLVVKHCPSDAPGYTPELAGKCEASGADFSENGRHVSAPGDFNTTVTFRNKYCALCYNITDYNPWDVTESCSSDLNTSNVTDMDDMLRQKPSSSHCSFIYASRHLKNFHICESFDGLINSCNVTGKWPSYDKDIETACGAYINPLQSINTNYRNVFCALCNGVTAESMVCGNWDYIVIDKVPELSDILNFDKLDPEVLNDNSGQGAHQCRPTDVYDNVTEKCRVTYCPLSGENSNNTCVKLFPTTLSVLTSLKLTATYLDEYIIPACRFFSQTRSFAVKALTVVLNECGFNESHVGKRDYASVYSIDLLKVNFSEIDLVIYQLGNLTYGESKKCLLSKSIFIQNMTIHERNIRVRFEQVVSFDGAEGELFLSSSSKVPFDEPKAAVVPIWFNESCPLIQFNSTEVTLINDTLVIDDTIKLESTDYFEQDGKQYFMCLDDLQLPESEPLTKRVVRSDSLSAEKILTGVCLSCSLVCLLLTLLVYILLRELHTVPGLNLILLTSSLFVAQALYLFGAGTVTTPTICTVLAVLIHYFWLVSFAWMNVCCIHMFRVFNHLFDSLNLAANKRCLVFKYAVFSYGVPACIVGATILTSFFTSESGYIGYGGNHLCFVAAGLTSIYSFGIPAGLTVLSNTGLLIYTVVQVRRAKSGYLSVDRPGASDVRRFFKLSTITGVSWVFGFLGYFLQRVELLYVFTLLAAGQGVFIFLSFVVSKRVWEMVRGRFAAGSRGNITHK